jgi:Tol biopolymer transport system component
MLRSSLPLSFCLLPAVLGIFAGVPQKQNSAEALMGAGLHQEEVTGKLEEAIDLYRKVLAVPGIPRILAARAYLRIGICYERLGREGALKAYETVLRDFADQKEISKEARSRLAALKTPAQKSSLRTGPVIRQLVTDDRMRAPGPPSPNGQYLAYTIKPSGDIEILDLSTGTTRQITHFDANGPDREFALDIAWSPQSDKIAYTWNGRTKRYTDLRVFDLRKATTQSIYQGCESGLRLGSWTLFGILVIDSNSCDFSLVSEADKSVLHLRPLDGLGAVTGSFAMSPDDQWIAYEFKATKESDYEISVVPADGGGSVIPIVRHGASDRLFGWAPDGRSILFTSDRTGTVDLWQIRVVNGHPQGEPMLIRSDMGHQSGPLGISRNGTLFYDRMTNLNDVYVVRLDPATGRAETPSTRVHPSEIGRTTSPAWSADGRFLAYLSRSIHEGKSDNICVWSMEDRSQRNLKLQKAISWGSELWWSPDGAEIRAREIDLINQRPFSFEWKIDARTGQVLQRAEVEFRVTRDGKTSVGYKLDPATRVMYISSKNVASGQETELFRSERGANAGRFISLSPDDRWLVFDLSNGAQPSRRLMSMPVSGGTPKDVLRLGEKMLPQSIDWSPDSRSLVCVASPSMTSGSLEIWKATLDGNSPQLLDFSLANGTRPRGVAVHPDGEHYAFAGTQYGKLEIWLMENVLQTAPRATDVPKPPNKKRNF